MSELLSRERCLKNPRQALTLTLSQRERALELGSNQLWLKLAILILLVSTGASPLSAQTPTGAVTGLVLDPAGCPVSGARLRLTNRNSGLVRHLSTSLDGDYSAISLPSGLYQIVTEADGFSSLERTVTVETGRTTTLNLTLQVGNFSEQVRVDAAPALMQYEQHTVSGLITRQQIEGLPLNGRNFLELAKLEPGVQMPTRLASNRVLVPALGQPVGTNGRATRVTVDGGSIMAVGVGGTAMGFSQELVQEFQVATVNFDLTTGLTNSAAINVTTRSGGNELHGQGFYFFRDHKLAAYPALNRDFNNPDPFFQRRQFGFSLGGPIRHDRFFFLGNYERSEQRGVGATTILTPEFVHLNRITASPFFNNQLSGRLDGRLSDVHTAFVRYSHDGIRAFGPASQPSAYPSSWRRQPSWADQSIVGVTSVFRQSLVNDFRFSYFYVNSAILPGSEGECPGCLGVGPPSLTVSQTGLTLGVAVRQLTHARRFHLNDFITWQRDAHQLRFGVDWEYQRGAPRTIDNDPASLTLFSPQRARQAGVPLPAAFRTLDDFLQLPLQTVSVGLGDPSVRQENGSLVRSWHTLRLFMQDTWRAHPRLTINYGLSWSIDRNLNHDLSKPELLAPILGAHGLGSTRKRWLDFSPVLGFAWIPRRNDKTVIRAGAGFYYDFFFQTILDTERALLGPVGSGRQTVLGNRLFNCLPGIPGVPVGTSLTFSNPTRFTGAHLMACLPAIRADLERNLTTSDPSIQAIQLIKQGTMNPEHVPRWTALHLNVGMQHEIARDFVVSADFAYRHFDHLGLGQPDFNHFNSVRGPVIPRCLNDAQRNDPFAQCSTGPINIQVNSGRGTYRGLLLRADKRWSHGFQLLGSWAYSKNTGTNSSSTNTANGFNLDNWLSNRGPFENDVTHILNLAGVAQLPWRLRAGVNFSYSSTPPFTAFVGGIDFNGDGTADDLLPGTTVNLFNRGFGKADLERLVEQFNQTHAGRVDSKGALIPKLILPSRYSFGDNFQTLDLRLSREFVFGERWRLVLIAEAFNVYNAANLTGHSGNVASSTFGQPTARFTQVFGSGGPRAFQLGMKFSF